MGSDRKRSGDRPKHGSSGASCGRRAPGREWIVGGLLAAILGLACQRTDPSAPPASDLVLAEVNGKAITLKNFRDQWSALPDSIRTVYSGETGRRDFLEELIKRELLLQRAREMKLDREEPIEQRVEAFRSRLLLEAVLNRLVDQKIAVTDEEIGSYFSSHRDALPVIEEVRAAHILVKTEAEARSVLGRIRRGTSFSSLARTHSIDPGSREKGGDLGRIRRGQMAPDLERVVFGLKSGQITEPLKSGRGYHIFRIQSRDAFKPRGAEDVRDEIRQRILQDKQKALFEEVTRSLRSEARVMIREESLVFVDPHGQAPIMDPQPP